MGSRIRLFGEAAFEMGFVTTAQLYEALTTQARQEAETGERQFLGEILVELGYMTDKQVLEILSELHGITSPRQTWVQE